MKFGLATTRAGRFVADLRAADLNRAGALFMTHSAVRAQSREASYYILYYIPTYEANTYVHTYLVLLMQHAMVGATYKGPNV